MPELNFLNDELEKARKLLNSNPLPGFIPVIQERIAEINEQIVEIIDKEFELLNDYE